MWGGGGVAGKANSKTTEELVLPVPPKLRVVPKTISFDIEEPGILYGETLVIKVRGPTRLDCCPRPSAGAGGAQSTCITGTPLL